MRAFRIPLALLTVVFGVTFAIICGGTCHAEASGSLIGKQLPHLETESLLGGTLSFPKGSQQLLIIGFRRECYPKVCEWIREMRLQRVLPPSVDFFAIPVCGDSFAMQLFRPIVISHIKQQAPEKEHAHVALYFGSEEELTELLEVPTGCLDPVLLFVNQHGTIMWYYRGGPCSDALESLRQITRAPAVGTDAVD